MSRRLSLSLILIGVMLTPVGTMLPAEAATGDTAGATTCTTTATPTIVGTSGDDTLYGTPGRDVIAGLGGNDVVYGLGGNDVIIGGDGIDTFYGGPGNDLVLGADNADSLYGGTGDDTLCGGNGSDVLLADSGNDTVYGGNDADVIVGSFGADTLSGDNDQNLLAGGPGNDTLTGGNGDDVVDGGNDSDIVIGDKGDDRGDDRLTGGDGIDTVSGDLGSDSCNAETVTGCETTHTLGTRTASLDYTPQVGDTFTVSYDVTASRGVKLVELYVNDTVLAYRVGNGEQEVNDAFTLPRALVTDPYAQAFVVVIDTDGEQTASSPATLKVADGWRPDAPQTALQLNTPMPMPQLVDKLAAAGLQPVEYRASKVDAVPMAASSDLLQQMNADGAVPYVSPQVNVIYDPKGTPLEAQVEEISAYYQHEHINGTPLINWVSVVGPVTSADLGSLAASVTITGNAARGHDPVPSSDTTANTTTTAAPLSMTAEPAKSGYTDGSVQQLAAAATPAADTAHFWPLYGQFNVDTYDMTVPKIICTPGVFGGYCGTYDEQTAMADLQHELAFTPQVLAGYAANNAAYEQDVTVHSPGRVGKRPFCNPFSADDFYVRAEGSHFQVNNIPEAAQPYNDTATFEDPCSQDQVSFGIVYPEKLTDGVPEGQLPVVIVHQVSVRDDSQDRDFALSGQRLFRDTAHCDSLPAFLKKDCIGIDTSQTHTAYFAKTGGATLDVTLPTCVAFKWLPVGDESASPTRLARCGGDADGDGWDNQVDCGPYDPTINPGAVDIPNDGIDQNCDGHDLTVGTGKIQVTLMWDNDNDLDLHVTDPTGTQIWLF
jgi:hypothetical protein